MINRKQRNPGRVAQEYRRNKPATPNPNDEIGLPIATAEKHRECANVLNELRLLNIKQGRAAHAAAAT